VIGWGLGIKFFDVFGERRTFRAVDGLLGPFLDVAPGGWSGRLKLYRGLAMLLMN
jgi:hypothetical protein